MSGARKAGGQAPTEDPLIVEAKRLLSGKRIQDMSPAELRFWIHDFKLSNGRPLGISGFARVAGVSRPTVYKYADAAKIDDVRSQEDYSDMIPWEIAPEHRKHRWLTHLRYMARIDRAEERGEEPGGSAAEIERAQAFRGHLAAHGLVVEYEPRRGFFPARRRPGVDLWYVALPGDLPERKREALAHWDARRKAHGLE